jgi:two-component system, NarL family, response regulator LiaR
METVMAGQPIQIMIVDDHAIVRQGMKAYLQEFEDIRVIGEAADGGKAVQLVEQLQPDVVLIDLLMPGTNGIETIQRMIAIRENIRILVLTAYMADDKFLQAIRAGALGYILKNAQPEELVQSIKTVHAGKPAFSSAIAWTAMQRMSGVGIKEQFAIELSKREIEVLRLLTKGNADKDIARKLVVSENTIRTHVGRIKIKLGVHSRVQAALYGLRSGMVLLDEIRDLNKTL